MCRDIQFSPIARKVRKWLVDPRKRRVVLPRIHSFRAHNAQKVHPRKKLRASGKPCAHIPAEKVRERVSEESTWRENAGRRKEAVPLGEKKKRRTTLPQLFTYTGLAMIPWFFFNCSLRITPPVGRYYRISQQPGKFSGNENFYIDVSCNGKNYVPTRGNIKGM